MISAIGSLWGRVLTGVAAEAALDHVFGYTIVNDVTSRLLQQKHRLKTFLSRQKKLPKALKKQQKPLKQQKLNLSQKRKKRLLLIQKKKKKKKAPTYSTWLLKP